MAKVIWSTRGMSAAARQLAEKHDVTLMDADFIGFSGTSESATIQVAIQQLQSEKANLVFTSVEAVKAIHQMLKPGPLPWKLACCGKRTAELAAEWLQGAELVMVQPNAQALAKALLETDINLPWQYICGAQRLSVLPDAFATAGKSLQEWHVYQTLLTPQQLPGTPDAVMFFSPSTIESYLQCYTLKSDIHYICMGQTTAAALKDYGAFSITIPDQPSKIAMLETAIRMLL